MRDFTVVPIEKAKHNGHIIYPTRYPLALQARQSTKEQNLHNQESYESQTTTLLEHALEMGWHRLRETSHDGGDIIPFIENRRKDGKIVDASGTKRVDERPTMQDLWYHIEHDLVKAVMTRGVDRLFRHIDMVEPAQFVKLCTQHRCIIITVKEVRRRTRIDVYNFHENPEDIGAFLAEAQAAADYILNQIEWMHRCKLNKAIRGAYDGRVIPVGYLLVDEKYVIYEPHARVIRWLFRQYHELAGNFTLLKRAVAQVVAEQGYLFPPFPDGMQHPHIGVGKNEHGYTLSAVSLKDVLCNPVYLGWWLAYETLDKGLPTEHRVLRARIEDHHEAIVSPADFWYAYERLADQNPPRSRYNKVGTISCDALLDGILTSTDGRSVYVYQDKDAPEKARYVIEESTSSYTDRKHGSLAVKELDVLFTNHLLAKLEAGKALRDRLGDTTFEDDPVPFRDRIATHENVLLMELESVMQKTDVAAAGIDANLLKYVEEAASLDRTLHYGAAKLPPEKIEEYAERLANLQATIAQLQTKKRRIAEAQAALAKFDRKLDDIPGVWKEMDIYDRRRFIALVTQQILLTKPAPNWLQFEIIWLWQNEGSDEPEQSTCMIWQRGGKGEDWTEEEKNLLREMYPGADRMRILMALPNRSWSAIYYQAMELGLTRAHQRNNAHVSSLVSLEDATFMAQMGIVYDQQNPRQRAWWISGIQTEERRY